ncbi:maleylpyruvate isomerase N-terminal domain-containing protein [Cellulomonas sp. HZM]|uniref:maleylpyruvate isomerase N-terminal domain-containing protein n=1 Tax=Cellulomonas sp. HZM TaxID=1454010 RepID=UPI0006915A29|nr:maleylpyruvate isomerase N-terminal domain-containing protein [Cellulomonas sp. HZM]
MTGDVGTAWDERRVAFASAASWFTATVGLVGARWGRPALGEWDVRALVGHTSRALLTVEQYLARPAAAVDVPTSVAYFLAARSAGGGVAADVARRGREAGAALGADPVAALDALAARVLRAVSATTGDELVTSVVGGMRLAEYLPTRTFELVVHTVDLAVALDEPAEPPAAAGRAALDVVAALAAAEGTAGPVLLALTGRDALAPGFTLL